jgi:heat shock protein HslJ
MTALEDLPASFTGRMPCGDCAALWHHFNVYPDGRFTLHRILVGKSETDFDKSGRWTSEAKRLELRFDDNERMLLEIRDQDTLRLLDKQGQSSTSQRNYELVRMNKFGSVVRAPARLPLQGTYWKLTRLGQEPSLVSANQPEVHFTLYPTQIVTGSGGCNRFRGGYTLNGKQIEFKDMARTLMACRNGLDQEKTFHDALGAAKRWHITDETLELIDDLGAIVATFKGQFGG